MSCTTCPTTNCTCCRVHSVAVDNELTVGGSTTLSTGTTNGGALVVTCGCTQTSGALVTVTGTQDQTAFHVTTGRTVFPIETSAPTSASDTTGVVGEVRWTADYVYVCVATGTWKRAALAGGW
jgi:hypothetical protein